VQSPRDFEVQTPSQGVLHCAPGQQSQAAAAADSSEKSLCRVHVILKCKHLHKGVLRCAPGQQAQAAADSSEKEQDSASSAPRDNSQKKFVRRQRMPA